MSDLSEREVDVELEVDSRVAAKSTSEISRATSVSHSLAMFGEDGISGGDSSRKSGSTGFSKVPYPALKFKSKNFMFPHERRASRTARREKDTLPRPKKEKFLKVQFHKIAKFFLYDKHSVPFGDYENTWLDSCEVNLLTGHSFESFDFFFGDLRPQIYADEAAALKYWTEIMLLGCPRLESREIQDTTLNNISLSGRIVNRVIPLFEEYNVDDLGEPTRAEILRGLSCQPSEVSCDSEAAYGVSNQTFGKLTKSNIGELSSGTVMTEEKDDNFTHNVYKEIYSLNDEELEDRRNLKAETDRLGFLTYVHNLIANFNTVATEPLMPVDKQVREMSDLAIFNKLSETVTDRDVSIYLRNDLFRELAMNYMVLKPRLDAVIRLIKPFRKMLGCPALNPKSRGYKKHIGTCLNGLHNIFIELNRWTEKFQDFDEKLKSASDDDLRFQKPIRPDFAAEVVGKFVCADFDINGAADHGFDLFGGHKFNFRDPERAEHSVLEPVQDGYRKGGKFVKGQRPRRMLNMKAVYPAAIVTMPIHFQPLTELMRAPMELWTYTKSRWTEIYISLLNSVAISALLNNNEELLSYAVNFKVPTLIKETSLLTTEKYLHLSNSNYRIKEAERTKLLYLIQRHTTAPIDSFHNKFDYMSKKVLDKEQSLLAEPEEVIVDALSIVLNPIIRADLFVSRKRHNCEGHCDGHIGMLLATLIRLGHVEMVLKAIEAGVNVNAEMCNGNVNDLYWDESYEVRLNRMVKKALKQQEERKRKEKLGRQSSMRIVFNPNKAKKARKEAEKAAAALEELQKIVEKPASKDEGVSERLGDDIIAADEVSMKQQERKNQKVVVVEEEEKKIVRKEEKSKKKAKKGRGAFEHTIDRVHCNKIIEKYKLNEKDWNGVENSRKGFLFSRYKRITPLAVAVDCAVSDIYTEKKMKARSERFTVLEFDQQVKEQNEEDLNRLDMRVEIVRRLFRAKANVMACDGIAVRALLPVVENLAKAQKKKVVKQRARYKKSLKDPLESVAYNKKPKLSRRESAVAMFRSRFSVTEGLSVRKQKLSSSQLLDLPRFEKDALKEVSKGPSARQKRYKAALNGMRVLRLVADEFIDTVHRKHYNVARKMNGHYATILLRVILVHEAVLQAKWDVVRFLCPYTVNAPKTEKLKQNLKEIGGRKLSEYDTAWKDFDKPTGEVIKKVLRLLTLDLRSKHSATSSRCWNGIFFLFKEYNITLAKPAMADLMMLLLDTFERSTYLKPGDNLAVRRFFGLRQVQHFLEVATYPQYTKREINKFSFSGKGKKTLFQAYSVKTMRIMLFQYCFAENMTSAVRLLKPDFLHRKKIGKLKALAMHTLIKKKRLDRMDALLTIYDEAGLSEEVVSELFSEVLEFALTDDKPVKGDLSGSAIAHLLLEHGVVASYEKSREYIWRVVDSPVRAHERDEISEDRCVDLTRYFTVQKLARYLFNKDTDYHEFVKTIRKLETVVETSEVWFQAILLLYKRVNEVFPDLEERFHDLSLNEGLLLSKINEKRTFVSFWDEDKDMLVLADKSVRPDEFFFEQEAEDEEEFEVYDTSREAEEEALQYWRTHEMDAEGWKDPDLVNDLKEDTEIVEIDPTQLDADKNGATTSEPL